MRGALPIGTSDFRTLREDGKVYVDKTLFVRDVLEDPGEVLLLPRPRRFGKTLNLSTLRHFFDVAGASATPIFDGLAISEHADLCAKHQHKYPVVWLSFRDVKQASFLAARGAVATAIGRAARDHVDALRGRPQAARLVDLAAGASLADDALERSLADLIDAVAEAHGRRVVVLVDEYDAPIHAGFLSGYYDDITALFRGLLSAALKDNRRLARGVLTGIFRVAKEGVFSGLNNIRVPSLLETAFSSAFGFTEGETMRLLTTAGLPDRLDEVRAWYDGYAFADVRVYNPWSVLSYLAAPEAGPLPYWVSTSSDDVLRELVLERGRNVADGFERLLSGAEIDVPLDEHLALRDLFERPDAVWSLLLFSGYLTPRAARRSDDGWHLSLAIPNRETFRAFERSIASWAERGATGAQRLDRLTRAMFAGAESDFADVLSELVRDTFSFHDVAGAEPERVYQAFVLGALVHVGATHEVTSNRESGYGRVDVLVAPRRPGMPGVLLELKRITRDADRDTALADALAQLGARDYASSLRGRGAQPILSYGVVFDGKRVWVKKATSA